jgi:CBS-domain-containing membrane protein
VKYLNNKKNKIVVLITTITLIICGFIFLTFNYQEKEIERTDEKQRVTLPESEEPKPLVEIANESQTVQEILKKQGDDLDTEIEEFPSFVRVVYKKGDIYIYGVDISRFTMQIMDEGYLD